MTAGFLPGCYKNFPQETGESLPGYLLRLSHANGYDGIADLLRACAGARKAGAAKMVHALRLSENDLKKMSRVAVGDWVCARLPEGHEMGLIEEILPRESDIARWRGNIQEFPGKSGPGNKPGCSRI